MGTNLNYPWEKKPWSPGGAVTHTHPALTHPRAASEHHEPRAFCPKCRRGSAKPTPLSRNTPAVFSGGPGGDIPLPREPLSVVLRRCPPGSLRASPSRGHQALLDSLFSLKITFIKTEKKKIPSVLAGKPFSFSWIPVAIAAFTAIPWPLCPGQRIPQGSARLNSQCPFPPATAFHVQRLFNNPHTF